MQTSLAEQGIPQPPQFAGSLVVSTHRPEHDFRAPQPLRVAHTPFTQGPSEHAVAASTYAAAAAAVVRVGLGVRARRSPQVVMPGAERAREAHADVLPSHAVTAHARVTGAPAAEQRVRLVGSTQAWPAPRIAQSTGVVVLQSMPHVPAWHAPLPELGPELGSWHTVPQPPPPVTPVVLTPVVVTSRSCCSSSRCRRWSRRCRSSSRVPPAPPSTIGGSVPEHEPRTRRGSRPPRRRAARRADPQLLPHDGAASSSDPFELLSARDRVAKRDATRAMLAEFLLDLHQAVGRVLRARDGRLPVPHVGAHARSRLRGPGLRAAPAAPAASAVTAA